MIMEIIGLLVAALFTLAPFIFCYAWEDLKQW